MVIILLVLLYNIAVMARLYNETRHVVIEQKDKAYMGVVNFLKKQKNMGEVSGFATPKINRYWYALGGDFRALGVFPYQKYHNSGHDYYYDDTTYLKMIGNLAASLQKNQFLIIKLQNNNLKDKISYKAFKLDSVLLIDDIIVLKKAL